MTPTPDDYIAHVARAGDDLAAATAEVMRLADERGLEKAQAIGRLIGTENPNTGKLHSASSAEAVVETDERYMAHRQAERQAEVERIRAKAHFEAARLKAFLSVGLAIREEAL